MDLSVALFCDNTTTVAYVRLLPHSSWARPMSQRTLSVAPYGDRVGMDPSSGGSRSSGPQMASGDPSFYDLPDREASSVFLTGLRFAGSGDGCFSPSLCLSSDRRHKGSSCQLRSSRNCEWTLIAPFCPQRDLFPDLLVLLSDFSITLSGRNDLIRHPHFRRFHQICLCLS